MSVTRVFAVKGDKATGSGRIPALKASIALPLTLAAALLVAPLPAGAQTYSFASVTIEGNQRIEPGTILSYAGIPRGETVTAGEINAANRRLLQTGLFESVEIIPRGSELVIVVDEYPTINRIAFEGNRRLDDEALAQAVESQSRRVYSPVQAERDAARIAEAYAVDGRLAATVRPRLIERSDNRVDLVFEIFEGGVIEIERIGIVGNEAYSDRRLRRVLSTKQAGLLRAIIRSDIFVEDRIQFDRQLLNDFYQSRGYVDFRITAVNAELSQERDAYFVTFNVEEGQQFRFGELTVSSDLPDVDPDLFQAALRTRPGSVYSPLDVERDIARLERLAVQEGLNFVRVEPRVVRNDRDLTLDIDFALVRGERIFVERIDIEGNTATLDRVIRRQFRAVEGDPFNPREIRQSAERIRALGLFADAEVEAREGSSEDQVIIDVNVEEQPTGSISFGASYSTEGGLGATVGFRERNFLGRGQSIGFQLSTTDENQEYSFTFGEPAFLGRDLRFDLELSYRETDSFLSSYDTAIGRFQPSFTFPVSENGRLQVRYTAESSDISLDDPSAVGPLIQDEADRGEVFNSSVGYTYSYDTRRTGLDPNSGILLQFGQDFAALGGDDTFVRTTARAVAQTRILREEVTLRATLEGGVLNYSDGSSRVTDRFFLGPRRLRGFTTDGIGPREVTATTDDALGGDKYAVARLEAEFPLGLPEEYGISGGVFYDVGSLWGLDTSSPDVLYEDFTVRSVIGVSIFWDTPIGPLRFNISEPLQKKPFDETQNFDFTIQTQF
ncbi:outer membrane protein assembly factor BamA [Rhodosalinus sp. K401]|uniref:outer membrane protein assembly factor BamA n=1 Tax=Rhodosalinus sp. K401 TaxID=3239195 RepID=UPI0035238E9A